MRKRTFEDKKFSQGDSNSDAYRNSWDRMFAPTLNGSDCSSIDLPTTTPNQADVSGQTECDDGCAGVLHKPQG